jgi:hypothetical protein
MESIILALVVLGSAAVVASGIWVAVELVKAISTPKKGDTDDRTAASHPENSPRRPENQDRR